MKRYFMCILLCAFFVPFFSNAQDKNKKEEEENTPVAQKGAEGVLSVDKKRIFIRYKVHQNSYKDVKMRNVLSVFGSFPPAHPGSNMPLQLVLKHNFFITDGIKTELSYTGCKTQLVELNTASYTDRTYAGVEFKVFRKEQKYGGNGITYKAANGEKTLLWAIFENIISRRDYTLRTGGLFARQAGYVHNDGYLDTHFNVTGLYLGVGTNAMTNMSIETDKTNPVYYARYSSFQVDLLYGASNKSNVVGNSTKEKSNWGVRAYWALPIILRRPVSYQCGLEVERIPGTPDGDIGILAYTSSEQLSITERISKSLKINTLKTTSRLQFP